MESPGEYLKRERELRDISLEDVHYSTRIQRKYLEALESDDYEKLPHPTFIKGFIKSYCRFLGVDENDAVLRYEIFEREQAGMPHYRKEPFGSEASEPSEERSKQKRDIFLLVAAGVVIIIVLYIGYTWKGGSELVVAPLTDEKTEAAEEAPESVVPEQEPENAEAIPPEVEEPEPAEQVQKQVDKPALAPKPAPEPAVSPAVEVPVKPTLSDAEKRHALTIKAQETVWVQVSIDAEEPFDVILKEGETITWRAAEEFALVVGNAGGVVMTFNGKELPPLGASGEVIRLELPWKEAPPLGG